MISKLQLTERVESSKLPYQLIRMIVFKKYLVIGLALFVLAGCKDKKKPSLSGEDPVAVEDFIDFFPEKKAPYSFADTVIQRREKDSLLISYKIFTSFVPDSLLHKVFGKTTKPQFFPLARLESKNEKYIIVKAMAGSRRTAYILAFTKNGDYMDGLPMLVLDAAASTQQIASVDRNFGVHLTVNRKNTDGSTSEGKDVYAFSWESRNFSLIMTEALDEKPTEIINPIDTFARKHKYSADYGTGAMNIVSIRDGRRSDRMSFFIHIEKNRGACTGELKGEAIWRSPTRAEYRLGGDPCVLRFTFTSSSVTLEEIEGCGAHRTLRCSFNGRYVKKKTTSTKAAKK